MRIVSFISGADGSPSILSLPVRGAQAFGADVARASFDATSRTQSELSVVVRDAQTFGTDRLGTSRDFAFSHAVTVYSVEEDGKADVYDLSVPGLRNFAIAPGIFVHNCDAVEETTFTLGGIPFSNFVLPEWFHSWTDPGVKRFDFLDELSAPFTLANGGYASIIRNGNFTDIFGSKAKAERFAREDRRGHRTTNWKDRVQKHVINPVCAAKG